MTSRDDERPGSVSEPCARKAPRQAETASHARRPGVKPAPTLAEIEELRMRKTQAIEAEDIADAVEMVLGARSGTVFDEITVTPLKKVIRHKDGKEPKPGR